MVATRFGILQTALVPSTRPVRPRIALGLQGNAVRCPASSSQCTHQLTFVHTDVTIERPSLDLEYMRGIKGGRPDPGSAEQYVGGRNQVYPG